MADVGTGLATNVAGTNIGVVIQKMKDVIDMEENLGDLKTDFTRLEAFVRHIENQFQDQQRALPKSVQNCLERMHTSLEEAKDLNVRANPRPRCLGCCSLRTPKPFTQIRDWKLRFDRLFEELERVLAIFAQQIVSSAAPRAEVLRQPVPESGIVGLAIQSNQMKLQTWLGEAHPQARMIGVYGTAGVGKTLFLKLVYDHYKEVSGPFDVIIWLTVSKEYQIEKLQASIAETLNLKLEGISDNDLRKLKLSDSLGNKKFLMILDDIWHSIDLIEEVGVKFGDHNCSKVLISSRSREVIQLMGASEDYTLKIQPLSLEEGWELFRRRTFANGVVPDDIEATAREIASECRGLPLALNAVAAAMRRKKTAVEWRRAFTLMTSADPSFQASNSTIEKDLYRSLKWIYDDLPNRELKICFLYCAVFPEDAEIPVETLVEMWSAEKLVTQMDDGHKYIDVLVERCLFQYVAAGYETIKTLSGNLQRYVEKRVRIHDVLVDLAIYIGQTEENWLFGTGKHLQNFPSEVRDCKRISVGHNDIQDLPTDLVCSELVSLVLANNEKIREVPERFLSTAVSLKILDLSGTFITSLPTSLGQLGQLEFLKLTGCYLLENLPESIGNLSHLRFLNLEYCQSLNSLPDSIGELRNLKHLSLESCENLMVIPHDAISRLTSLNKLFLPLRGGRKSWATSVKDFANLSYLKELAAKNVEDFANLSNLMELAATTSVEDFVSPSNLMELAAISVEDFANLSNLMELTAAVKDEIKESTMTTWTNLRRLEVWFYYNADRDDVVENIFPFNMETLTKLEHFELHFCERVSLPNCISQFENLTTLYLSCCPHLRELPACEIGNEIVVGGGFPMLKRLELENLNELESMVGSSVVSSEEIMPGLEEIRITDCRSLKRLGTKKFLRLKRLSISGCEEFEALEIESAGLPMLEDLQLFYLKKCEIVVGPSGVINDEVMPKLKVLEVHYCGLLKLGLEKLPNLRSISIRCEKLRELPLKMGSDGFPVLERLSLWDCANLENIVGSLDVWNDKTMPNLELLDIRRCSLLRRLPTGIENLPKLRQIIGGIVWWQKLLWEDEKVKNNIFRLFREYRK